MKKQLTPTAKKLRKNPTEAEKFLWYILQRNNLGYKFRRQAPIGQYIVDFVCYQKKLIIEIDGGQHYESVSDKNRDNWLSGQGFTILRFWNNQILENRNGVAVKITEYLKQPPL